MDCAIRVQHLGKTFVSQTRGIEHIRALEDVNLEIFSGEILGILGPNGAGKTTFLNILATLLLADQGTVEILGYPLNKQTSRFLRTQLNMSSGHPNFPWSLTVEENLKFYGRLYGLSGPPLQRRVDQVVEMFTLADFRRQRFDELSSGTKQRLALAKCLVNHPKIIFLDEPTVGLDPDVARKTREVILDIFRRQRVTILLTTHNMQEAELMCQRIAFLRKGRLLHLATPQELKQRQHKKDLEEVFIDLAHQSEVVSAASRSGQEEGGKTTAGNPLACPRPTPPDRVWLWLNRCAAFTYRNYLYAVRNFFAFVELVFWPMVSLLSIGLMGRFLQLQEHALAFVLTGAITAGILQVTQLDVAYSLLYEVWAKSMKHTMLTPVGVSEHLFGSWLIGIIRGTIIFLILGISAILFFGFPMPSVTVTLFFLFGIFFCALLLGMIVSLLILAFGQKAEITAWMFAYLFMLLCGIYYPIETLPRFFSLLAQAIPITYFLEYFRQGFGFPPSLTHPLAKGLGLSGLYLVAGLAMMRLAFYKARKNGIIVRLSE